MAFNNFNFANLGAGFVFRIPFAGERPRRSDLFWLRCAGRRRKIVRKPIEVAAVAMAVVKIRALAPKILLVQIRVALDVSFAGRRV